MAVILVFRGRDGGLEEDLPPEHAMEKTDRRLLASPENLVGSL